MVPARRIGYDKLVIAVGSGANDFGTPGVLEHCYMIDSRRKADDFNREIRLRMLRSMTEGETLQVAIVGAARPAWSWRPSWCNCPESAKPTARWARPPNFRSC